MAQDVGLEEHPGLAKAVRAAGGLAIAGGAYVLLIWPIAASQFAALSPGRHPMLPITASLFALAGLALCLQTSVRTGWRRTAQVLGIVVVLAATATLVEYLAGIRPIIDRLPYPQPIPLPDEPYPGRMPPNTAITFVLLGLALVCLDVRVAGRIWLGQVLALLAGIVPYLALLGYAYELETLFHWKQFNASSLPTSALSVVLVVGLLAARPQRGLMARTLRPDGGGIARRWLWPATLIIPPTLAAIELLWVRAGGYPPSLGLAVLVLVLTTLGLAIITAHAAALDRADDERLMLLSRLHSAYDECNDLYNDAPCGYHSLDGGGAIVRINNTELRWLGYDRADVLNRIPFRDLLAPESRARFDERFPAFIRDGTEEALELELVRKDGSRFWAHVMATAVRDAGGRFLASRTSLFDVTARRRMEGALRKSEANLARAQRITRLGSWEWDLQSGTDDWSDEVFRLVGLSPRVFQPGLATRLKYVHPEDRARLKAVIDEARRLCCSFNATPRIVTETGETIYVDVRGEVECDAAGHPTRVVGTVQDVTELRRTHETLARRTTELEHTRTLANLKDRFLSVVSHELKTPLTVLMGYAELLEDVHPHDPLVLGLLDGGRRLADRVNALVDYSALLSGSLPMVKVELSVAELLEFAVPNFQPMIQNKRLRLVEQVEPELPTVLADPRRLQQALCELLENCVRFAPLDGEVGVTARARAGDVFLEVWDNGPGIAPEVLPRLWEAFATVEVSKGLTPSGLGIGLAIARAIVEAHGGRLSVSPRVPHGTTFTIRLPRAQPKPSSTVVLPAEQDANPPAG